MIDLLYKGGKNEGKKKGIFIKKIVSETDIDKLNAWFQLSLKVSSIEDFEQNM